MLDIANNASGLPVSLVDISKRQEIDYGYLEQIIAKLKKGGLVESVRGAYGGYKLARAMDDISVLDVTSAMEEKIQFTKCKGSDLGCREDRSKCAAHELWYNLEHLLDGYLAKITLADVCMKNYSFLADVSLAREVVNA
jgi:Rrf2 family iron-sulfur cluster assembly transcriptional regulator